MKKIKITYWILTGLFSAFMIFSAIPDAMSTPEAVQIVHDTLGYPIYLIPFLGIAKLLGAIVILIPGLNRLKEWAYAGLLFDLIGALYSLMIVVGDTQSFVFMVLPIIVGGLSYYFHHKKLNAAIV